MGKNYIEEASLKWLKDNDLKENEIFLVNGMDNEDTNRVYFNKGYTYLEGGVLRRYVGHDILYGGRTIEKIKPKTLMEQLKEQGFGWLIHVQGNITREYEGSFSEKVYEKMIQQGSVFLTESEAEREVYRRELEFEMQEWARENDALVSIEEDYYDIHGFSVYLSTVDYWKACDEEFKERLNKYYNWGD